MIRVAAWGPLVIIGIFASTLSSALAGLIGAPRILKAVCEDKLFQPLLYFAKGREKDNEPVRGYFLAVAVAFVGIGIGDLNAIAPLITNFFLATRTFINLACFMATYSKSPGWRPTYKYYNANVSLFTAFLCVLVMFAISWIQALITLGIGGILYYYVKTKAPEVNWGAAEQGLNGKLREEHVSILFFLRQDLRANMANVNHLIPILQTPGCDSNACTWRGMPRRGDRCTCSHRST